ncbi:MAG: PDZ domain-containing protein [Cyclobacteriaceae bacterium]
MMIIRNHDRPSLLPMLSGSPVKPLHLLGITLLFFLIISSSVQAQGTRLLRQPTISDTHIAFTYGGDVWISSLEDTLALRITSTPAVEQDPHLSPDGQWIAFTSNRSGSDAVYIVPIEGGTPTRLTWHPSPAHVRGWTQDGTKVLYATTRNSAPATFDRLWTVSVEGGPATQLSAQWGTDGSFSPEGDRIVIDRVRRWDSEWRGYRGGQNTPLSILNLSDQSEVLLPHERTTDIQPLWIGKTIYFLSDRDGTMNIWSYMPDSKKLEQVTEFTGSDIKTLEGWDNTLTFERDGYLHLLNLNTQDTTQLNISISGDFPWAEPQWEDVSKSIRSVSLSPTGKRAIMEARGEIFTVPVENGTVRNITQSSEAADRAPVWSPQGKQVAWFSDIEEHEYALMIASQKGLLNPKRIPIGESKMAWEPVWSPDGKLIAFVDDDVRVRVLDIEKETIQTVDTGGVNIERGGMGLSWSHDSQWLAYARSGSNYFRQIKVWSRKDNNTQAMTDEFADAFSPTWDRDGKHLYFLASTDVALSSGWANTSAMNASPQYAAYLINLNTDDPSPFSLQSDDEPEDEEATEEEDEDKKKDDDEKEEDKVDESDAIAVTIAFENLHQRTIPLPVPERNYGFLVSGPAGSVFMAESIPNKGGLTLQKFVLEDREAKEYTDGVQQVSVSADGNKLLAQAGGAWKLMDTSKPNGNDAETVKVDLQMKVDRPQEWEQIFEEAWRYERDYFYDPNLHGRNWGTVYERYAPLIPFIKHRTDLTYILDQVNGELSVGHSFVFGGDYPNVNDPRVGLLGADLVAEEGRWKIARIYTTESWNPDLTSPLDQPGTNIDEGHYLVGINGEELTADENPFERLDGTLDQQTVLHINKSPEFEGAWQEIVKPIRSENALRQRAWVEDNRRRVDSLSNGQLAYVWVPNTSGQGLVSFNRYYFAQQNKKGAVIDERFNGGGLLDDYMVDLMTRRVRAAYTNEVPNGKPGLLPAGILGPKVLLINEMAGSGGDFFPWVFRQQQAGPLIGARTWGGLVKSSVHYALVDGGALTAPDNAIFDPINQRWIAENEGVPPDIPVRQDAKALAEGRDPQLERAVEEVLKLMQQEETEILIPEFSTPASPEEE